MARGAPIEKPPICRRWFYHLCYRPANSKGADDVGREKTDGSL